LNVRSFISFIPFDIDTCRLNDTNNQPRSEVYNYLQTKDKISLLNKYKDHTYKNENHEIEDSKLWTWENYRPSIWRAIPITPDVYINSPIYDMINIILWKIDLRIKETFQEKLEVDTVVQNSYNK